MKKILKIFGWVFLGIFLQFKFSVLYGIVFLENLNFHDRTYLVKMNLIPASEKVRILHVETIVHHSLGPDYFANVYISDQYKVLNQVPFPSKESPPDYLTYQMNMKRKYRDVLSVKDLLLVPAKSENISPIPILVKFENMTHHLYTDSTYVLSTNNGLTRLEGPVVAETTFPQKWGM